ncbi:MAG: S-adenosylmethionine decarboxylase [bacterium]|nr:S-adenosylmethionine decarboxylase [bacterium]
MITKRFHHILDLENCNANIEDREALRNFVEKIAASIDMKISEGPIVAEGVQENPGLSVLAIIDFSHISIHTFAKYREALVDVFSCKEYDREKVLAISKEFLATPETKIRHKEVWWG